VILPHVLGYRSLDGIWGLPYLWQMVAPLGSTLRTAVSAIPLSGAVWLVLGCGLMTLWMHLRLRDRPRLFAQVGAVFALFLAGSSGFGVQYLLWLVPFTVALGSVPALLFHVTTGAFLFAVYDYWAGGRPWYLSDSNLMGPWPSAVEPMQVMAWIATTGLLLLFVRWVREGARSGVRPTFAPDGIDGPGARALVAAVVVFVLITSAVRTREVQRELAGAHARMSPAAVQAITIEHHLRLAEWMATRGDLRGALAVATRAAAMDSTSRAAALVLLQRTLAVGDTAAVMRLAPRVASMREPGHAQAARWPRP